MKILSFLYLIDFQRNTFFVISTCLLYFMRISPLVYIDALRYIREGIRVAHADYPHQLRQAFRSPLETISAIVYYKVHAVTLLRSYIYSIFMVIFDPKPSINFIYIIYKI